MSRYSHAAVLGLLLVSCQKESISRQGEATNVVQSNKGGGHDEPVGPAKPASPCVATNKPGLFLPLGESGGNTLALLRVQHEGGNKTLAIAADEDEQALHIVDVDSRTPIAMTKLAGKPSRVLVTGDGRIVVSLSDIGALEVLEPAPTTGFPLTRRCLVQTPADPSGLTLTNDQKTLLVTSRWEPTLSIFDVADMKPIHSVELPRDPTNVMASTDGKRAYVTHAAGGIVSLVDLEWKGDDLAKPVSRPLALLASQMQRRPIGMPMSPLRKPRIPMKMAPSVKHERIGSQGFVLARSENKIFAPLVMVEPKPPRGSSSGYGSSSAESPPVVGEIASIDEKSGQIHITQAAVGTGPKDCFLPRAAVVDNVKNEIFVSCLGIDAVIVYDASKKNPHNYEKRRIPVPAGPTGLAIDPDSRQAVVFSSFAGQMTFVALTPKVEEEVLVASTAVGISKKTGKSITPKRRVKKSDIGKARVEVTSVVLPDRKGLAPEIALGRSLFHSAGRRNIAFDGRACASCHPDGRDDGLTWQTQEGPRQTPILLGRLTNDTAPFGWLGDKDTLPNHFKRTIERLAGTGLKDSERDAIFAYINSLSAPKSKKSVEDTRISQGKAIFESKETGCSSCHLGEATTDGDRHNVESAQEFEVERKFETPSLRFIAQSAPYFHDGRYATLMEMIQHCDGSMGSTNHLAEADKVSLAAYLETL